MPRRLQISGESQLVEAKVEDVGAGMLARGAGHAALGRGLAGFGDGVESQGDSVKDVMEAVDRVNEKSKVALTKTQTDLNSEGMRHQYQLMYDENNNSLDLEANADRRREFEAYWEGKIGYDTELTEDTKSYLTKQLGHYGNLSEEASVRATAQANTKAAVENSGESIDLAVENREEDALIEHVETGVNLGIYTAEVGDVIIQDGKSKINLANSSDAVNSVALPVAPALDGDTQLSMDELYEYIDVTVQQGVDSGMNSREVADLREAGLQQKNALYKSNAARGKDIIALLKAGRSTDAKEKYATMPEGIQKDLIGATMGFTKESNYTSNISKMISHSNADTDFEEIKGLINDNLAYTNMDKQALLAHVAEKEKALGTNVAKGRTEAKLAGIYEAAMSGKITRGQITDSNLPVEQKKIAKDLVNVYISESAMAAVKSKNVQFTRDSGKVIEVNFKNTEDKAVYAENMVNQLVRSAGSIKVKVTKGPIGKNNKFRGRNVLEGQEAMDYTVHLVSTLGDNDKSRELAGSLLQVQLAEYNNTNTTGVTSKTREELEEDAFIFGGLSKLPKDDTGDIVSLSEQNKVAKIYETAWSNGSKELTRDQQAEVDKIVAMRTSRQALVNLKYGLLGIAPSKPTGGSQEATGASTDPTEFAAPSSF